jgi:RNA polymerase sigma-70 factor (ECF subfamily)
MASARPSIWIEAEGGSGGVTRLLDSARAGDGEARRHLLARVYEELRVLAGAHLHREGSDHTLQPTALAHEVVRQLLDGDQLRHVLDRGHLLATASRAMRHVLVDHARAKGAEKRGGDRHRQSWSAANEPAYDAVSWDVVALHEALGELERLNPRHAEVVEMRFFGGFTVPEIARHLEVSVSTVEADQRAARAWLRLRLGAEGP